LLNVKIGLEVHCQLTKLKSKLFCPCPTDYRGKEANTNICPICMGLPGTLPLLNKEAVFYALKVALALNSRPNKRVIFFRKNYFYPDLPKNFQITQYDGVGGSPFSIGGYLKLSSGKEVRIRRINLEEDPGKIYYEGSITSSNYSLIDYNRAGIALLEIVTEPDMNNPKEAREFLEKLRDILESLEVSEPELEGAMRCDANISLMDGSRVEIKNISSFKEVEKALNFEITRQRNLLSRGIKVRRETRHWDEVRRITVSLREKEEEQDYRYFPEPDLLPINISEEMIQQATKSIPELPDKKEERYIKVLGLPNNMAKIIAHNKELSKFFETSLEYYNSPKRMASLIVNDLLSYVNRYGYSFKDLIDPLKLAEFVKIVEEYKLDEKETKEYLQELLLKRLDLKSLAEKVKLDKRVPKEEILELIEKVLKENPKAVKDYQKNKKVLDYLVGKTISLTKGRLNVKEVRELLKEKLEVLLNDE